MKILNCIAIILLIFSPTYHCSIPTNPINITEDPEVLLIPERKILHIKDSMKICLKCAELISDTNVISWSADLGTILGTGNAVKYIAPNKKGLDIIRVNISDGQNFQSSYLKILIYQQLIFLKADDLIFDERNIISPRWKAFIDFILYKNIKASVGLIGNSLEKGNFLYLLYLACLSRFENFEIWNHGYNHLLDEISKDGKKISEFQNSSYEFQKQHLLKTQNLAKKYLNVTLHTFGAPGNAIDQNTLKAIEEIDDIKIWYFGSPYFSRLNLIRFAEIEFQNKIPDFENFQSNYDSQKLYLVYQIHPNSWNEKMFSEFKRIIDFLVENEVTFINPYEYYQLFYIKNIPS